MFDTLRQALAARFGDNSSHLILSVVTVILALALWKVIARIFHRNRDRIDKAQNKTTTVFHLAYNVTKYVIIFVTVIVVLQFNGINVSAMVAGLGVASAIVGFALQDEIKDLIMGIHLATDNFFQVGDVVTYGDLTGKVVGYSLKYVRIESIDDHSITTVCNSNITEITKCSDIFHINVPLSYDDDPDKIEAVLRSVCSDIATDENVTSATFRGTQNFNDSSIDYRITIQCPPETVPDVRRMANRLIQRGLARNGLSIPFNQLDLHVIK